MIFHKLSFSIAIAIATLASLPAVTFADLANYGNFFGDNVTFCNVRENSSFSTVPLYEDPTPDPIDGDTLTFQPGSFDVNTEDGGFEFIDGLLRFTVKADPGFLITSIRINEGGGYNTLGEGSTADARAIGVANLNGSTIGGTARFNYTNTSGGVEGGDWETETILSIPSADEVGFSLDNQLLVNTVFQPRPEYNRLAFIDKKFVNITVETVPVVPEPAAATVALAGLAVCMIRRRRTV